MSARQPLDSRCQRESPSWQRYAEAYNLVLCQGTRTSTAASSESWQMEVREGHPVSHSSSNAPMPNRVSSTGRGRAGPRSMHTRTCSALAGELTLSHHTTAGQLLPVLHLCASMRCRSQHTSQSRPPPAMQARAAREQPEAQRLTPCSQRPAAALPLRAPPRTRG